MSAYLHDNLLPWHTPLWPALLQQSHKGGGLLLSGPSGHGKRHLARYLSVALLCEAPSADGHPCGRCASCHLCKANQHPDWVEIATEQHWDDFIRLRTEGAEPGNDNADGGSEKEQKVARDIRIADVRRLERLTTLSAHRGGRRVVLIWPADEMTTEAANALLKTLEEPGYRLHFILVSAHPGRLLPTVRSRVRIQHCPPATRAESLPWLKHHDVDKPEAALGLSTGAPLKAMELAAERAGHDSIDIRDSFVRWLLETDPARPDDRPAVFDKLRPAAVYQMMVLTASELLRVAHGLPCLHLAHLEALMQPGRRTPDMAALHVLARDCLDAMPNADHPLNMRMQMDALCQRWFAAMRTHNRRRTA